MPRWELAAENILVKIRWFGLLVGYIYVNWAVQSALRAPLNAILGLGAGYALLDSIWSLRGRVFWAGRRSSFLRWKRCLSGFCVTARAGSRVHFASIIYSRLSVVGFGTTSGCTVATCALHLRQRIYLVLGVARRSSRTIRIAADDVFARLGDLGCEFARLASQAR